MCQHVDTCKNTGTQKQTQLIWCKLYTSFLELNTSLRPYGSNTHLHTEYINWHIGAFVHLYIYCDSNLSSLPVHVYLYEDQDLFKIFLNNVNLIES